MSATQQTTVTETSTPLRHLYKSTVKTMNIITPQGKILNFKFGRFATDEQDVIEWLDRAVAKNEFAGTVFIDPNQRTTSADEENPAKAYRDLIIKEYLEQQARLNPNNDMGTSDQGKLRTANTTNIAAVTAGGDAAARLIPLSPNLQK